jgi:hypothetical protein
LVRTGSVPQWFYKTAGNRRGWHRNGIREQLDRLVNGPGQANLDLAISKMQALPWLHERTALQFRAEFFNAFNHPQFANPDSNFSSPTFGVISSTSVSARVAQLALKLSF